MFEYLNLERLPWWEMQNPSFHTMSEGTELYNKSQAANICTNLERHLGKNVQEK